MMQNQFSIIAMIEQGWYATGPLLLISVVCVTIIIERIWALWGISRRAAASSIYCLGQRKYALELRRRAPQTGRAYDRFVSHRRVA